MKKVLAKLLNVVVDIVVVLILVVSIVVLTAALTSRESGVPNFFGNAPMAVRSNSMEDTFNVGDLIIGKVVEHPLDEEYKVGDIVTFKIYINNEEQLNTHRIVEVVDDHGVEKYRTQGDNKKTNPEPDEKLLTKVDILARYTGTRFAGIGGVIDYVQSPTGFFFVILLPMIIFFLYQAVRVVINIIGYTKEKALLQAQAQINDSDLTEEQKKRAIEEYLAQQAANAPPEAQTPPEE